MSFTRIEQDFQLDELEQLAARHNIALVWRTARCQQGRTRQEWCGDCDYGYVTDTHAFANIDPAVIGRKQYAAVSDDGVDVAYIPSRFADRLSKEVVR